MARLGEMLQWITEGGGRAKVRHARNAGATTDREWAISHGNSQMSGTVSFEDDVLAANDLACELSIALFSLAQRATRKRG